MKCRYPDVFACALLNAQPMGFYAPAQIVRDARDHGVAVLPVDINLSDWDCTLEPPFSCDGPPSQSADEHPSPGRGGWRAERVTGGGFGPVNRSAGGAHDRRDASSRSTSAPADSTRHPSDAPFAGHSNTPRVPEPLASSSLPTLRARRDERTTPSPNPVAVPETDEGRHGAEAILIGPRSARPPSPALAGEGKARLHPRHAKMRDHILGDHALRLGFRQVKGLHQADMDRLVAQRGAGYDSVRDLWLRAAVPLPVLERLAEADAFRSIGLDRRDALWAVRGLNRAGDKDDLPLFAREAAPDREPDAALPPMPLGEHVVEDYRHLSLSLKAHPVSFVRSELAARRILPASALAQAGDGRRVSAAGLVLVRQRPGSANGTIFLTIEDETGVANVIVWPKIFEGARAQVIAARFLSVTGKLQHESGVTHIVAERFDDLTPMLTSLSSRGAEIQDLARADEVKQGQTFDAKTRGHGTELGLKLGFPLAADTRKPRGEPAAGPLKPDGNTRDILPKGRNFH